MCKQLSRCGKSDQRIINEFLWLSFDFSWAEGNPAYDVVEIEQIYIQSFILIN